MKTTARMVLELTLDERLLKERYAQGYDKRDIEHDLIFNGVNSKFIRDYKIAAVTSFEEV